MKVSALTLLLSIIAIIAGQQYGVNLSNMRLLQTDEDGDTEVTTMDDGSEAQGDQSMFTDDPLCKNSVNDDATGTYTDGSSGSVCTTETGYADCPCYGKMDQEAAEGIMMALGAYALLWICLMICVPVTCCCIIGCVVYKMMKDK